MQGWLVACTRVEFSFLYSCHHLPWGPGYKDIPGPGESSHFLPLHQPALWHSSHLTLIPHLSEAKTCLAFDSKPLALFGLLPTEALATLMGPGIAKQHQRHYQTSFHHQALKIVSASFKYLMCFNDNVVFKLNTLEINDHK